MLNASPEAKAPLQRQDCGSFLLTPGTSSVAHHVFDCSAVKNLGSAIVRDHLFSLSVLYSSFVPFTSTGVCSPTTPPSGSTRAGSYPEPNSWCKHFPLKIGFSI